MRSAGIGGGRLGRQAGAGGARRLLRTSAQISWNRAGALVLGRFAVALRSIRDFPLRAHEVGRSCQVLRPAWTAIPAHLGVGVDRPALLWVPKLLAYVPLGKGVVGSPCGVYAPTRPDSPVSAARRQRSARGFLQPNTSVRSRPDPSGLYRGRPVPALPARSGFSTSGPCWRWSAGGRSAPRAWG